MSNTFGQKFRFTTWGESHGPAIGVVVDGCPAGISLEEADLQHDLDRRRPGQSQITTQRGEDDRAEILSGVFEGKTTGTPISILIKNKDANSSKYDNLKDLFRPGHADFTYWAKWGHRDHRGGGRASARETASRVAAGAIARKFLLERGITVQGFVSQIADIAWDGANFDIKEIDRNSCRCPDAETAKKMEEAILAARKAGDSLGGIISVIGLGVPPGLGEPQYGRLDSDLASAFMGINAVKGVEVGAGFRAATMKGSEHNDAFDIVEGAVVPRTNNAGGILGGISTGAPIVITFAVKPTSSILSEQDTVTISGEKTTVSVEGRHDPCVATRAVPVGEAMMAVVLADHWLRGLGSRADSI
ncbi:MAG: chorismate synthase [Nitrospinaceae bacterium]|nr:chorismate synthase [Nitrospinaceae bacterium]MBT3432540.1 chorismate synthase [Nitrospinaceae bacterium]MBT3821662.1 chorismate synthase [Nitrospinaceae bacterium]MBT4092600.1 chorismate synthase [Nitrospinaceae bacterium]MBT4431897.1 chorismate synthase [Nitrospinaceae bacterium]